MVAFFQNKFFKCIFLLIKSDYTDTQGLLEAMKYKDILKLDKAEGGRENLIRPSGMIKQNKS